MLLPYFVRSRSELYRGELLFSLVRAAAAAGCGHPSNCASAGGIMAVPFSSLMRYDPKDPKPMMYLCSRLRGEQCVSPSRSRRPRIDHLSCSL